MGGCPYYFIIFVFISPVSIFSHALFYLINTDFDEGGSSLQGICERVKYCSLPNHDAIESSFASGRPPNKPETEYKYRCGMKWKS